MKLLAEFVRRYPWQSAILVVALLVAGVAEGIGLSALLPLLNLSFESGAGADLAATGQTGLEQAVVDVFARVGLDPSIRILLVVMVVAITLKSTLVFLAEQRVGYIAADVATGLRIQLLHAITASRWAYFVGQSTGSLANSLATEAKRAADAYVYAVRLLALIFEVCVYAFVALVVSWVATMVCLAAAAVIFLISNRFVLISKRAGEGQTHWYRSLLSTLTDVLHSVKTFKAMGRESSAEEVLAFEAENLKHTLKREVLGTAALRNAQEPMFMLVLAVGIYLAVIEFSFEMSTVLFLVLALSRVLRRLGKLQRSFQQMITCETAYWAVQSAIREARLAVEQNVGVATPTIERGLSLESVSVAYDDRIVLDGASLEIPSGKFTCLIGASGTGKTTVADLMIGLVEPNAGSVLLDGVPLEDVDLAAWRGTIGYVPQDNLLMHDTVLHNVILGATGVAERQVENALRAAGAWDFVDSLPDGVMTIVGERGAALSGGQRQRIMLARAIVHEPQFLVLDEATSALDAATEIEIYKTLAGLKGSMTILSVSHKSAATAFADKVYELRDGKAYQVDVQATVSPFVRPS
ncbi:MAG: ABC transporter ATP-binding protein [Gammaproteobacteria bacterium]|nr:ABC transporter ATP-binding protein [Gammaproteobacteria bacterium]